MPSDRTVLEHLLEGRDALVQEVKRLTTAIEELDSVIERIGGDRRVTAEPDTPVVETAAPAATPIEPVETKAPVEVESAPATPAKRAPAKKAPAKKAPAKRTAARAATPARTTEASGTGQKSIRVHVLEMLGAEDRDFGLAEIIDKIHAEGIQAHDDGVRSSTIKLMKDGRAERVGRGLYRLARRGSQSSTAAATPPPAPTTPAADYVPPLNLGQSWQRPGS